MVQFLASRGFLSSVHFSHKFLRKLMFSISENNAVITSSGKYYTIGSLVGKVSPPPQWFIIDFLFPSLYITLYTHVYTFSSSVAVFFFSFFIFFLLSWYLFIYFSTANLHSSGSINGKCSDEEKKYCIPLSKVNRKLSASYK